MVAFLDNPKEFVLLYPRALSYPEPENTDQGFFLPVSHSKSYQLLDNFWYFPFYFPFRDKNR